MPAPLPRRLLAVAAFLASFVAVVLLVRGLTVPPHEYFYRSKLEYYEAHADEYNAVFLGSSLVFRSFMPAVIDAELARGGVEWHSLNLGVPAMRDLEVDYLLRRVLERRSPALQWVVLEFGTFKGTGGDNLRTYRGAYWHDVPQTWQALRAVAAEKHPPEEARALYTEHLTVGGWRLLNVGFGPRLYEDAVHGIPPESLLTTERIVAGRGFVALDEGMPPNTLSPRITRNREEFERLREALPRKNARPDLDTYPRELLREQVARIQAAGLRVIYVIGPGIRPTAEQRALAAEGAVPVLFAYDDPEKYPELYDIANRFDPTHPNQRGAVRTSLRFAADLRAYLRREGGD